MAFEPDFDGDMSYDDAAAAISAAAQAEEADGRDQAPAASTVSETPKGEEQAPAPVAEAPEQPAEAETQEEESFFNPDDLPPELLPGWKQLQAAFTQKTQALAEQRRELEQFGDLEAVADAVELYGRLSDPDSWVQLHGEITDALVSAGYDLGTAQQMAAAEMDSAEADLQGIDMDDPDLAPIANQLQTVQEQLAQQQAYFTELQAQREWQEQAMEAERAQQEYIAHMQQQVSGLRQAFPHYGDEDIRSIVELGSFYNDDLGTAQSRYEEMRTGMLERYLSQKEGAQSPTHPSAASQLSQPVREEPEDIRELEDEMVDLFRQMQAEGDIEF